MCKEIIIECILVCKEEMCIAVGPRLDIQFWDNPSVDSCYGIRETLLGISCNCCGWGLSFEASKCWLVNRVIQSCHLLVCLFIYRHFTVKLAISEYGRWHLFVIYYAYLILTYCWFDSNVNKQKNKWQLWTALIMIMVVVKNTHTKSRTPLTLQILT